MEVVKCESGRREWNRGLSIPSVSVSMSLAKGLGVEGSLQLHLNVKTIIVLRGAPGDPIRAFFVLFDLVVFEAITLGISPDFNQSLLISIPSA